MINAVVFDMDGLMFDTERLIMKAWDFSGEKMNVGKAGFMALKTLGLSTESSRKIFLEQYGDNFDYDKFREITREFQQEYFEKYGIPIKDGLFELLTYLKRHSFKLAVATSTSRSSAMNNFERAGVSEYFSAFICGDMIERGKPSPDIYLKACEQLCEPPENCLALEDSPNGILSAYNAGMKVIMVPDLIVPDEKTASMLYAQAESLNEVISIVENDFLNINHAD